MEKHGTNILHDVFKHAYGLGEKSQLYRAGADSPATIKTYIAMKKESVKKQIETMLEASEEVFQSKGVSDFKVTSGNFKGWYAAKIDDEENRREMEEHLRKRAAAVAVVM